MVERVSRGVAVWVVVVIGGRVDDPLVEGGGWGVTVWVVVVIGGRVDDPLVEGGGWRVTVWVVVVGGRECIEGQLCCVQSVQLFCLSVWYERPAEDREIV
jgi:hypothetical protein